MFNAVHLKAYSKLTSCCRLPSSRELLLRLKDVSRQDTTDDTAAVRIRESGRNRHAVSLTTVQHAAQLSNAGTLVYLKHFADSGVSWATVTVPNFRKRLYRLQY